MASTQTSDQGRQGPPDVVDNHEGEEDEELEEEEPPLKYQRLGMSVPQIVRDDVASCMAVHEKFLALGTHHGMVYILDLSGNDIKQFAAHSTTVNELAIDTQGEFVASCSNDGRVVIHGLYSDDRFEYSYTRPVRSVALDPDFAKKSSRPVASGGMQGQLILNTRGWFGPKDQVLHAGEGPVTCVRWNGPFLAWANDVGVKVYDSAMQQKISFIDRPASTPSSQCAIAWQGESTIIVAWQNFVKVATIKERRLADRDPNLPLRFVEITAMFQTEFLVSGVAPYDDHLLLLAYDTESADIDETTGKRISPIPDLRVMTKAGEELSSDALSIKGYETYGPLDYRLEHQPSPNPSDRVYYIISPRDIVLARPRDIDDHITWLVEHGKFEEALVAAQRRPAAAAPALVLAAAQGTQVDRVLEVGEKYLTHLFEIGDLKKAAELCPTVLNRAPERWEKWVFAFENRKALREIMKFIPTTKPTLSQTVYELVLNDLLRTDAAGFESAVAQWTPDLYNTQSIITAVQEAIKQTPQGPNHKSLLTALAQLHMHEGRPDRALVQYLRLRRSDVFDFIAEHSLFESVRDKILELVEFSPVRAVGVLVQNVDKIPIEDAVRQLTPRREFLHQYLHALFVKDPKAGADFHPMQVELYALYEPKSLLGFLASSQHYQLDAAYGICRDKGLLHETVYLLGRMGNTKEALYQIIHSLHDVKKAVEFVESQNDEELWEDIITQCVQRPEYVSDLLEHIGAHVDPIKLIRSIPQGMQIPKLRDKLVKIISDYSLQMSLQQGCRQVLKTDCAALSRKLNHNQKRGVRVDTQTKCAVCSNCIVAPRAQITSSDKDNVIVFFCSHAYHETCYRDATEAPQTSSSAPAASSRGPASKSNSGKFYCIVCNTKRDHGRKRTVVPKEGPS